MTDSIVDRIRGQIAETDRALVETINERIELVRALWQHKEAEGLPILDPAREERMLQYLTEANEGPLSTEGLAELYAYVLDLTKREVRQPAEA